jgi:predicted negative regulator of RcsB-dependent stress response
MYRLLGDLQGEASSLLHRGDVQHAAGAPDGARRSWEQALALLAEIPGADTSEAASRLARDGRPPEAAR